MKLMRAGGCLRLPPALTTPVGEVPEMAIDETSTGAAALEILKRLEPVLTGIDMRLTAIEARLTAVEAQHRALESRLSRIEGQLTHMPTATGIATTILIAVIGNGAATAAIVFAILNYARTAGVPS